MRNIVLILAVLISVSSCKSTRSNNIITKKKKTGTSSRVIDGKTKSEGNIKSIASAIINNANSYHGVKYKYGGVTKKGMDCSGLIYVAFKEEDFLLPRVSRDMAKKGYRIKLMEVKKGDLLFFQTNKSRKVINHVGLVTESKNGNINFIHATTSNGVITSSFSENYWNSSFIEARRIL